MPEKFLLIISYFFYYSNLGFSFGVFLPGENALSPLLQSRKSAFPEYDPLMYFSRHMVRFPGRGHSGRKGGMVRNTARPFQTELDSQYFMAGPFSAVKKKACQPIGAQWFGKLFVQLNSVPRTESSDIPPLVKSSVLFPQLQSSMVLLCHANHFRQRKHRHFRTVGCP